MTPFVLDASVVCTWCLRDERTVRGDQILNRCLQSYAVVPALWPTEVTNALWTAERKRRVNRSDLDFFLQQLSAFDIRIDSPSLEHSLFALDLARAENPTVYDASYLALADQLTLPWATFDEALAAAAKSRNIVLL